MRGTTTWLSLWGGMLLALAVVPGVGRAQNVIVVIADDVGAEWFDVYGEQGGNPPTPTVEALAAQGVRFSHAWGQPVCSPFRISVYTGLHPHQHRAGHAIDGTDEDRDYALDPTTPNLGSLLAAAGYRTAAVGKWHMAIELGFSGAPAFADGMLSVTEAHPNLVGIQHFAGFLFGGLLYFDWWKTVNGVTAKTTVYATTDTADSAIAQLSGSEPFFLWVGFNAPHAVFHDPPPALLADPSAYTGTSAGQYRAMIEAMDTELGRVLQNVDLADTTVLFTADNGTYGSFLQPPRLPTHGKATVYEGGVRVPLIVAGQAVAPGARGSESAALVQATDLFATVLDLAGLEPPSGRDALSILPYLSEPAAAPTRKLAYTEVFTPNGGPIDPASHDRAIRDGRYKLIRRGAEPDELYDLELDPHELAPLDLDALRLQQWVAYQRLGLALLARTVPPAVPSLSLPGSVLLVGTVVVAAARALRQRRRV